MDSETVEWNEELGRGLKRPRFFAIVQWSWEGSVTDEDDWTANTDVQG